MSENIDINLVLSELSFWERPPKASYQRHLELPKTLVSNQILAIIGVRRCGKSTLLTQLPAHYDLPLQDCYFCNFEDPRLALQLDHTLLEVIKNFAQQRSGNRPKYFFFDEIHHVELWEKWLHIQLERPSDCHYVVTGSNSKLLAMDYGSALMGRHRRVDLFPFSFDESKQVIPDLSLQEYLARGGFPGTYVFDNPKEILREYFASILARDVLPRIKARSAKSLHSLLKMTYDSCGSEVSYRKLGGAVGLAPETVRDYMEGFEQAHLVFSCPYFSYSERKTARRNKKYYPIDTGLLRAVTMQRGQDLGKAFEAMVFLVLKRKYEKVHYWKEKGEVDFVCETDSGLLPVQVTWNDTKERHNQALEEFYLQFRDAREALFINRDSFNDLSS